MLFVGIYLSVDTTIASFSGPSSNCLLLFDASSLPLAGIAMSVHLATAIIPAKKSLFGFNSRGRRG